jgi:hypothetical protein
MKRTLFLTVLMAFQGYPGSTVAGELILGGTSGGDKEAKELHWNTKFCWGYPDTSAEAAQQWGQKTTAELREVGVKYLFAYAFGPGRAADYSEYTECGQKYKALATGYSWLGPLGNRWLELVAERASWNLPLAYNFVPDEIYYNNAHVPYAFGVPVHPKTPWYPQTPGEQNAFKEATGLAFPSVTASRFLGGDTKLHRTFILFRYRILASTIKSWYVHARTKNPGMKSWAIFNLTDVYGLERYPGGIALDFFGEDAGLDYAMATAFQCSYDWRGPDTHYFPSETVKHLRAGFPKAKVICFPSAKVWLPDTALLGPVLPKESFPEFRPIDMIGVAVSGIGHGADGFIPYAAGQKDNWEAQERAFRTLRDISPWVEGSRVPGNIVVLHSRAGEDWYALANEPETPDPIEDGSMAMRERCTHIQMNNYLSYHLQRYREGSRGYRTHKSLIQFLFKNAMPFRLHYLDTLRAEHLAEARLVALPFAHAISKEASDIVHRAVADGKNLLLCGMLGERDLEGEKYPAPLLADLVGEPGVLVLDRDDALNLSERSISAKVRRAVLKLLGNDAPLVLRPAPKAEVEAALREKGPAEKIVFLVNWSSTQARMKVGIPLPTGTYALSTHDTEKITDTPGQVFTDRDLAALPVTLPPLSARVLYVRPASR